MMDDHTDEQLDEWIREAAHSYHNPPPAPRNEMWHAIQAARRTPDVRPIRRPIRWLAWSVGVAAVLALGVSIGLIIASDRPAPVPVAAADDPAPTTPQRVSTALAVVTTEHLTQFVSAQPEYSMLVRNIETEIVGACHRYVLGILPFFPLAMGVLTGKYKRGADVPEGTRLAGMPGASARKRRGRASEMAVIVRERVSRWNGLLAVKIS